MKDDEKSSKYAEREARKQKRNARLQEKYGNPILNVWVNEKEDDYLDKEYHCYLEGERTARRNRNITLFLYVLALFCFYLGSQQSEWLLSATVLFFLGNDGLTNFRIDCLQQSRIEEVFWRMYRLDKNKKKEKDEKIS